MIAALRGDETVYHLLVTAHILTVVVGFGSTFVYPLIGNYASKIRGKEAAAISDASLKAAKVVTTPMIYAAAVFGLTLVAVGPFDWDMRFVQAAIVLVVIAVLFAAFVHVPNLQAMNSLSRELADMGPPPASTTGGQPPQAIELERRGKAAARNGALLDLLFVALVLLMVFKPL